MVSLRKDKVKRKAVRFIGQNDIGTISKYRTGSIQILQVTILL